MSAEMRAQRAENTARALQEIRDLRGAPPLNSSTDDTYLLPLSIAVESLRVGSDGQGVGETIERSLSPTSAGKIMPPLHHGGLDAVENWFSGEHGAVCVLAYRDTLADVAKEHICRVTRYSFAGAVAKRNTDWAFWEAERVGKYMWFVVCAYCSLESSVEEYVSRLELADKYALERSERDFQLWLEEQAAGTREGS